MPKDNHQYYLDTSYEVWRSGGNSDRLDYDRVLDHKYEGREPHHAAAAEMRRWQDQRRQYQASQEDEDYGQAQEYYAMEDEKRWAELEREMALDAEYGPVIHPPLKPTE